MEYVAKEKEKQDFYEDQTFGFDDKGSRKEIKRKGNPH